MFADRRVIISQLADDATHSLKDAAQIPRTLEPIKNFSKVSGLSLNMNKCDLMAIKKCHLYVVSQLRIKLYLGVIITKDDSARRSLNFEPHSKRQGNNLIYGYREICH
uniref:Reverse transcriptase domain-containing protein n=1 Tax=Anguilla anguilla TaxID=7936 RepID=A0A0E9T1C4_ANGAN